MSQKTSNGRSKHTPVRGKYAAAFKRGVNVVIHTEDGDKTRRVRRKPDGKFEWKHTHTTKSDKAAARLAALGGTEKKLKPIPRRRRNA